MLDSKVLVKRAPRVLEYRASVRLLGTIVFILGLVCFILALLAAGVAVYNLHTQGRNNNVRLAEIFVILFVFLGIGILAFYQSKLRPFIGARVQVYDNKIQIKYEKEKVVIPFKGILHINSPAHRKSGCWFEIVLRNKKKYRFSPILERVEYLLEGIHAFNKNLIPIDEFEVLHKRLVVADHSRSRISDIFSTKYLLQRLLLYIGLPITFVAFMYFKQSEQFTIHSYWYYFMKLWMIVVFVQSIFGLLFLSIMNFIIRKRSKQKMEDSGIDKIRDLKFEKKVFHSMYPLHLACVGAILFGVYTTQLNVFEVVNIEPKVADKYSGLRGGVNWVDNRYNCEDCNYLIESGDFISTSFGPGQVIGMPQDYMTINKRDEDGRVLASFEETLVAPEHFVILAGNGQSILVSSREVRGKIISHLPLMNILRKPFRKH